MRTTVVECDGQCGKAIEAAKTMERGWYKFKIEDRFEKVTLMECCPDCWPNIKFAEVLD